MNGERPFGGTFPIAEAGPQRQIAVPTPRVSVGVTNTRKKLETESIPSIHPTHRVVLQTPVNSNGDAGQTVGI